jgi:surface antigen
MRAARTILGLGVAWALIATLVPVKSWAEVTSELWRSLADLSNEDREALERAQREVLETMKPGAVSVWKDDKTGHSGEARLLRMYQQNGMACGEVGHVLKILEVSHYVVPLCRTSDGTWRVAY